MIDFVSVGALIADIALVCTFVISISAAFRKGFTILVFNFICLLITIVAVLALCKPLTNFVYDKTSVDEFFSKHIKNSIGDFIETQLEKNDHINTGKTIFQNLLQTKLITILMKQTIKL